MATRKTLKKSPAAGPVLVTGASGFLGTHLVGVLRQLGHEVRSLGRTPSEQLAAHGVDQRTGSVASLEDCRAAVAGVEAIYHCAGFVSRDKARAGEMYDVHVTGTRNILQAAKEAGVTQVLCVSTSGVNGVSKREDFLGREETPYPWDLLRRWPYYESKAWAEKEIALAVAAGLPVKLARPTLLLGPGDRNGSSTGDIVKFLCGDVKAALPGGVSVVDVRDVASVLPRLMDKGEAGVGYLLTGANLPLRDFFLVLEGVSGVEAPRIGVPKSWLDISAIDAVFKHTSKWKSMGGLEAQTYEMACHYWYVDAGRARRDLRFAPRELVETLRDTVADLRPGLPPR